jgi:hypothetical protein
MTDVPVVGSDPGGMNAAAALVAAGLGVDDRHAPPRSLA